MILILAAADDDHAAAIEPELRGRGASVVWLDLAELPSQGELSVSYGAARARPVLRVRDVEIDLRAITAAWSLHPRPPVPHASLPTDELRDYVRQETVDTWIGDRALLDCLWMPGSRWHEQRASHKPLQLQLAAELGFETPPTLITNSRDDFLDFHRRHDGAIVSKTVHNRLLPVDTAHGYTAYVLTEIVANRDVSHADAVRYCPVTVQPYVDKRVELRVTVVGDRVFPVALDSQWTNHTRHDWRRGDHHHGRYAIHDLPPDHAQRCVELVRRLGLCFGAIDLILTPDGRYVFLEINPNGAWLWMQRTTGLPIGAAICDVLMSREPSSPSVVATLSRPAASRPTACRAADVMRRRRRLTTQVPREATPPWPTRFATSSISPATARPRATPWLAFAVWPSAIVRSIRRSSGRWRATSAVSTTTRCFACPAPGRCPWRSRRTARCPGPCATRTTHVRATCCGSTA